MQESWAWEVQELMGASMVMEAEGVGVVDIMVVEAVGLVISGVVEAVVVVDLHLLIQTMFKTYYLIRQLMQALVM